MMKLQVHHVSNGIGLHMMPIVSGLVTINPYCIRNVFSTDVDINGQKLKQVTIFFTDGDPICLNVSFLDATAIEDAVGLVPEF